MSSGEAGVAIHAHLQPISCRKLLAGKRQSEMIRL